jgi:septum formation protein
LKQLLKEPPETLRTFSGYPFKMRMFSIDSSHPLTLASASPRRKQLLAQVNIPYRVVVSRIDESIEFKNPKNLCLELAVQKAVEVAARIETAWVLGADTIVAVDGHVLGKPENSEDARNMLARLAGNDHRVITGFAVIDPSGATAHAESVTTVVRFKPLKPDEISRYIKTTEPFGKAGAYAIQGIGAFMVESISGSYTNVVGLPVCAVIKALSKCGALRSFPFNS